MSVNFSSIMVCCEWIVVIVDIGIKCSVVFIEFVGVDVVFEFVLDILINIFYINYGVSYGVV